MTDTLIARRNIVVSSSRLGKDAKSSALPRYIVAATIVSAAAMLSVISRLSSGAGSGTTSIVTTSTTRDRGEQVGARQDAADGALRS